MINTNNTETNTQGDEIGTVYTEKGILEIMQAAPLSSFKNSAFYKDYLINTLNQDYPYMQEEGTIEDFDLSDHVDLYAEGAAESIMTKIADITDADSCEIYDHIEALHFIKIMGQLPKEWEEAARRAAAVSLYGAAEYNNQEEAKEEAQDFNWLLNISNLENDIFEELGLEVNEETKAVYARLAVLSYIAYN